MKILVAIRDGNNTRIGLGYVVSDSLLRIGELMKSGLIRPEVDAIGLTRFYVNGERMADLAAFISGLGHKPLETRTTTCTVETVAREIKALESP